VISWLGSIERYILIAGLLSESLSSFEGILSYTILSIEGAGFIPCPFTLFLNYWKKNL
jgi:hypothetical protein